MEMPNIWFWRPWIVLGVSKREKPTKRAGKTQRVVLE
jgi:hypothetical protein